MPGATLRFCLRRVKDDSRVRRSAGGDRRAFRRAASEARRRIGDPGAIAQMGERLLCKQEVTGSIPVGSIAVLDLAGF